MSVELIDAPALGIDRDSTLQRVIAAQPNFALIATTSVSLASDLSFAETVKKQVPNALVTVTGSQVSVQPGIALTQTSIDGVIRDEIEMTVLEIASGIPLEKTQGIHYKQDGHVRSTPPRPWIKNLDELPFPAYELMRMESYAYEGLFPPGRFFTVYTSRGCPYGCIYCPYPIGMGEPWRWRSPENVADEVQHLVENYGVEYILFRDQVFTLDMKRAERICDLLTQRRVEVGWKCETRADRLSKELLVRMKNAGCMAIHVGIESGDPDLLRQIGKPGVTLDMVRQIFREARRLGIRTHAFFMIGLPGDTRESVWRTIKFAKDLDPDEAQFSITTPYPGTKLHDMAEQRGWILSTDPTKYTNYDVVMRNDDMSAEELRMAHRMAYYVFYKSPRKFLRKVVTRESLKSALDDPANALHWLYNTVVRDEKSLEEELTRPPTPSPGLY